LHFGATDPDLPLCLLHLRTAFFEAHLLSPSKTWQVWILKSYKVFKEPPNTIAPFCFVLFEAATALARQFHQERTQVVCSNKVDRSRLAFRHSRYWCYFYVLFVD